MARKALGKGLDALIPGAGDEETAAAAKGKEKPGRPGEAARVTKVRLGQIRPNPHQPRKDFEPEALEELAASIKQKGVLQPVLLRPAGRGEGFEIVAGERRFRAAQMAGLRTIPAIVYDIDSEEEMLELALVENVQREDLNVIDMAEAFDQLASEAGLTQEEIAERVGKSRSSVTNILRLLKLPDEIQGFVRSGDLNEGHARALLAISGKGAQIKLAKRIISRGLTVREVERAVAELTGKREGEASKKARTVLTPRLQAIIEEMQRTLGTKVTLTGSEKKGSLKIDYYTSDDLTRICDKLDIEID